MEITQTTVTFLLGLIALISILFAVYHFFRNPQIKTDQTTLKLRDDIESLKKQIHEIKETHLRAVEGDVKLLTTAVNELSKTVIRLTTIIDERIPRGNSNLTPQGT